MGLIKKRFEDIVERKTEFEKVQERVQARKDWEDFKSEHGTMDEVNHRRAAKNLPSSMR
jgi:hypothetical protein